VVDFMAIALVVLIVSAAETRVRPVPFDELLHY